MKLNKILVLILAIILSGNVFLTSCSNDSKKIENTKNSSSSAEPKNITMRVIWWGSQTRADATKKVLDNYSLAHKNVKFETEFADFKGYWDKLATFAASNSLPDLMQQDYGYLTQYVKKRTLADIQPYIDKKVLNSDNIDKNMLKLGDIDGKNYGISLGVNSQSIIYNPELYKNAGVDEPKDGMTWKNYFDDAEKMYRKTKTQVSLPFNTDPKLLIEYWVRSAGKSLYNKNGTALGFSDEKLLASLFEEEQRLIKTGAIYDPAKGQLELAIEESGFVKGKDAGGFAWSNFLVPDTLAIKKDLKITTLPKAPSGDEAAMYIKPSMFFSVADSSENKEEAVKVIDYFTNDLEANKILKADRGVPISSKVRDELKSIVDPAAKQTFEYIDFATKAAGKVAPPEPAGAQEVQQLAFNLNNEVINNKKTPKDAAKEFIKSANDILIKNK